MTEYPYILFNKSPEQLRRLGARGDRAHARNQRARRVPMPAPPPAGPPPAVPQETAAQAIRILEAQFPWLRDAGKVDSPEVRRAALAVGRRELSRRSLHQH